MVSRLLAAVLLIAVAVPAMAAELGDDRVAELSRNAVFRPDKLTRDDIDALIDRGQRDVVPAFVLGLRYGSQHEPVLKVLSALTGEKIVSWKDAVLWQEVHPEVTPHPSYREIKLDLFRFIDPNFVRFLGADRAKPENLKIRLEEIVWGGVPVDGIPSLDNPKLIGAGEADYLHGEDLVFGIEINGDVRAYPLRIMGWHEMFNETIGGVPVALAYCTLCGAGILFETKVEGRDKPLVFGSSGLLYRSNKLMFDRETDSLWNQFTGRPVSGPLVDSGIELRIRPVAITSWTAWKEMHPDTKVLSLETGFRRNYGSGVVYKDYFASPELMFPTNVRDETVVKRKDYVFGIRTTGASRAWPVEAFNKRTVINDVVGDKAVVLIGDALTRTVRAYERRDMTFSASGKAGQLAGPGGGWTMAEDALVGPDGTKLPRVPGHVSYWFAWDGYLGTESTLYRPGK